MRMGIRVRAGSRGSEALFGSPTVLAEPVELNVFAGNNVSLVFLYPRLYLLLQGGGHVHVVNGTTLLAYKVVVRFTLGLIDIVIAAKAQTTDHFLIDENIEVAVDVAQTQGRKLLFELVVDPVGRYMHALRREKIEDSFALFAFSQS